VSNGGRQADARREALLCVCGLAAEALIARRAGFAVVVGAGDRRHAAGRVAAKLPGVDCIVSFGIAGALAPALRPGDLVLSGEIVSQAGVWRGDAAWRRHLAEAAEVIGAAGGPVLGAPKILAQPAEKARAFARYAARAVDLESDIVAQAAVRAGIRFAVLRAIADPAARALPPAALVPLTPDGRLDLARVLGSLLRRPQQAAGLLGLARETRLALQALERAVPVLGGLSVAAISALN
jgi:adenosylhomocysteine nucleosidase